MIFVLLGLVVDCIWRSYYLSKWYAAALISGYLMLQIIALAWEAKTLLGIMEVDEGSNGRKWAMCEIISIHSQNLV